MKILYLTGQLKSHGGIEKVLSMKLNSLETNFNQDVSLITYEQGKDEFIYPITSKVHYEDIQIDYDLAIHKNSLFSPVNIIKGIRHFFLIRKKIKLLHPDIIITPNLGYDFIFLPFIERKIPKIREIHSSLYMRRIKPKGIKAKLTRFIDQYFEKKYSCIIVLNKDEQEYVNNENVRVIPNPIHANNVIPDYNFTSKTVAAGRLSPVKGFDKLIQAWEYVVKERPDLRLDIYGEGEEHYVSYLKQLIVQKHLEQNITLCGCVPDLGDVLSQYSLFVCSSQTECFPMVLLEAMSFGVPVVSFDCPYGPRNIILNGKTGFLVKDQDIKELAEKVLKYYSDSKNYQVMRQNAYKNSLNYNIDKIMSLWMDLFQELIGK